MSSVASQTRVAHADDVAQRAGVTRGMSLGHARALLSPRTPDVFEHDPDADQRALHRLAAWAHRFVPRVAPDPDCDEPDDARPGLLADATGCARLYRGEGRLLRTMLDAVTKLGFSARIATAPTLACAWAVARFGVDAVTLVPEGGIDAAVADLPLRALRIRPDARAAFASLGVTTLGQLAALPRGSLPARFGPELVRQLDRLHGHAIETLTPEPPAERVSVEQRFDGPVKQPEAIERAARGLLDTLCERLRARESGARRVDLILERSDCKPWPVTVSVSRFCRDPRLLWTLLRPPLERAHLGYGVLSLTLTATRAGQLVHRQRHHAAVAPAPPADVARELAAALDVLENRLGPHAVLRAHTHNTHNTERAVTYAPATTPWHGRPPSEQDPPPKAGLSRCPPSAPPLPSRPPLLLDRPRPVNVIAVTPDGPLRRMVWEHQTLNIRTTLGPERLASVWWDDDRLTPTTRDYFRVQDHTGRWWWVYRQLETPGWFVHGRW